MTPTMKLRFVSRRVEVKNRDAVVVKTLKFLQQWWEFDGANDPEIPPIGEWRDVVTENEDD